MRKKTYNNIGIVGFGAVGSHIAFLISEEEIARNIIVFTNHQNTAEAKVQDIKDMQMLCKRKANIHIVDFNSEAINLCDCIIITYGNLTLLKQEGRNGEYNLNLNTTNDFLSKVNPNWNGLIIVISNPCDEIACEVSKKLEKAKVISTGTALDTMRLNALRNYPEKVDYIFGKHGQEQVVEWNNLPDTDLWQNAKEGVWKVIKEDNHSVFAISKLTLSILNSYIGNRKIVLPLTYNQSGRSRLIKIKKERIRFVR